MPDPRPDLRPGSAPAALVVAAGLAALEGLLLLGYAVLEAAHTASDRASVAVTTALFFAILGAALIACAWLMVHGRAWTRSPIVVSQLMFLGLAWNFAHGTTWPVAVGLGAVSVVILAGVLHPASTAALTDPDPSDPG